MADTVGAEETFHAATLVELDRCGRLSRSGLAALGDDEIHDLLTYAVTASSITCSRRGADLPRDAEVRAALSLGATYEPRADPISFRSRRSGF